MGLRASDNVDFLATVGGEHKEDTVGLFDGKVVVVTGGGRGIGRAQALAFAREGAKVVVNDHGTKPDGTGEDPSVAADAAKEIGANALASSDNVAHRAGVERLMRAAIDRFGRIDVLVHGAGFLRDKPLLELDDEGWEHSQAGLLRSTFLCVQGAAKHMVSRGGGGRIIVTSSIVGLVGSAGMPAYAAAKAGIYGLARVASMELKPNDITVNVLSPIAYTRLTKDLPVMATIPNASSLFAPDYVADVTLFLTSDAAADITGNVVDVQGKQVSLMSMKQGGGIQPKGDRWTTAELRERWAELSS
jgi:NAD(P)-dependent dehydrogenase (short-subunit alcohol dehydrogenase family)